MSPTPLKNCIGLRLNPWALSPTPLGLIPPLFFRSKPSRIDKQTLITTNMSPTPLKDCIGLGNPGALSPMPVGLIQPLFLWSIPSRIDKQTLIKTTNHEPDPIKKLHWTRELVGTVPDASQANSASFLLVKTFRN